MVNATTHSGATQGTLSTPTTLYSIGPRGFAALLGMELLLFIGLLVWALFSMLPPATPLATRQNLAPVQAAIRARIGGAVHDPLVPVNTGVSARASNLRGLSLGEGTYYYYVEGASNFDPLSRGVVSRKEIEVLLRDDSGPQTFVIYRIL